MPDIEGEDDFEHKSICSDPDKQEAVPQFGDVFSGEVHVSEDDETHSVDDIC